MSLKLEEDALALNTAAAVSAGTTVDGAVVDMAGYEGVLFFCTIATANAGNYLKAQQGEASNLSDAADLAGTKVVAAANGSVVCLEVNRPKERYVRPNVVRGGANTAVGDIYQLRYRANNQPTVNQITNLLVSVSVKSPAEGTP